MVSERYFNDDYTKRNGINKSLMYFDGSGEALKIEQFYSDEFTKKERYQKA